MLGRGLCGIVHHPLVRATTHVFTVAGLHHPLTPCPHRPSCICVLELPANASLPDTSKLQEIDGSTVCMLRSTHINIITEVVMPSLQHIESQIAELPEPELRKFRSWFDEFDAQRWDTSLTADISNGKLDSLAEEALSHYSAGKCKPL